MSSRWNRSMAIAFAGAFALCAESAVAQDESLKGHEFIPAPNEPCGVNCPDPDAPLSRVNYSPRDDGFNRMFVPTESGLMIAPNPHWNGTFDAVSWLNGRQPCGVYCRDSKAPVDITNPPRRNDAASIMVVVYSEGESRGLRFKQNPHWAWAAANEAIENSALYPSLPLLGLGGSSTEVDLGAEESGSEIVSRSVDRTGVAYHATRDDVFQPAVLQAIGGVLSQGSVGGGRNGQAPKVAFALGPDGTYPGYVLVSDGAASARYRIRYDELVPMALFVDGGGTSLYTLWSADRLPADFQREAGFAKYEGGPGFVAIEFAATRFADALFFLDTCAGCVALPDDDLESAINARTSSDTETGSRRVSSYINADVGLRFKLEETKVGAYEVTGGIVRFRWSGDVGSQRVSVDTKLPIVHPGELRANLDRWLTENEDVHILRLMAGIDIRKEGRKPGRRKLADAYFLFETLALLRATKLNWPEHWSTFMAVLSSEWLARKNREPWERYTGTYCGVYPAGADCAHLRETAMSSPGASGATGCEGYVEPSSRVEYFWRQADEKRVRDCIGSLGAGLSDDRGFSPLHRAVQFSATAGIVPALLNVGADPNATTERGWTPLHVAAEHAGNAVVFTVLLEGGADPTVTAQGQTAFDQARNNAKLIGSDAYRQLREAHDAQEAANAAPDTLELTKEDYRAIQRLLNDKGFRAGPEDGRWGSKSRSALRAFQALGGLGQTGVPDQVTRTALGFGSVSKSEAADDEGAARDGVSMEGDCRVGQELQPGQGCKVPGSVVFSVRPDGCGNYPVVPKFSRTCFEGSLQLNQFKARMLNETSAWRIEALPPTP